MRLFDSMAPFFQAGSRGRLALSTGVICVALSATVAARAESFHIKYSVRLVGVPLGSATLSGSIDPAGYKIDASARLTGIASVVSNAKGAATAAGVFQRGSVAPNSFATTSANDKMTRTIRIAMQQGNVKAAEITPPFDNPPDRIQITEAQKHNILDPLSALLMPVATADPVVGPAACNRTLPVFDGWTRFDIPLAYNGNHAFEVHGYKGQVAVCGARYTPISGHRERPIVKWMAENKNMDVWLGSLADTRVTVPFRMNVKTLIGMLTIEATDVEVGKANQAAER